jgi:hypothetical protein
VYRSDNRGDSWTRVSPDLSRQLNRDTLPIMGKVWPRGSVALNASTTDLSNVVAIDESPVLEVCSGSVLTTGSQVTEDGGKSGAASRPSWGAEVHVRERRACPTARRGIRPS